MKPISHESDSGPTKEIGMFPLTSKHNLHFGLESLSLLSFGLLKDYSNLLPISKNKIVEYTWLPLSKRHKRALATTLKSPSRHYYHHIDPNSAIFYDLGTRFKGGRWLHFYAMNYWSISDSKQLLTSSFIAESQKQAKNIATSHRNLEVTSVSHWHIIVISPYHTKLFSHALTCLCAHTYTVWSGIGSPLAG